MAGWLSNGVQVVQPRIQNGVTIAPVPVTNLGAATPLISVDIDGPAGLQPQTAAATPFQVAAAAMGLINNTVTSTVHTGTLNTEEGMMVTEALTTAAAATYTFQIVNSLITATSPIPQVQIHGGTNTGGTPEVTSITNATGTATVVFSNIGTSAFNGTMLIGFHV